MAETELLPCPFCGSPAEIRHPFARVECSNVNCNPMPVVRARMLDEAITAWNRRASLSAAEKMAEALREIADHDAPAGASYDMVAIARTALADFESSRDHRRKPG